MADDNPFADPVNINPFAVSIKEGKQHSLVNSLVNVDTVTSHSVDHHLMNLFYSIIALIVVHKVSNQQDSETYPWAQ